MKEKKYNIDSLFERKPGDLIIVEKLHDISKDPVAVKKREDGLEILKKAGLIPQNAK